jgi:hypothetical protein
MHSIRTFILRLFVDSESCEHLRGTVQIVTEDAQRHFFSDESALIELIREMLMQKRDDDHDEQNEL